LHATHQSIKSNAGAIVATPGAVAAASTDNHGHPPEAMNVSLAKEVGTTIRTAITEWPQTLRLASLLAAASGSTALIVLLLLLLRP